ncbi:thiopeptide-type bacteriocin biosynthesis protein [Chryseobacterium luteum]|uniref:Thiopeptide-type bacteriocin biosynthesis domain-containing protein n=1 Tax=Chryseobacterium luteum TaxID=421531 RepID=A0A085ZY81_9FLAO|nr:thiopeptide-type bacteriocin biosynthesis protein [Chryseobacterium luteum]KFF09395.1 hypothetical protein IX38_02535 [Chryseobacterium luteum]
MIKKRIFPPGSEWVYFKIYLGYKSADTILTDKIYPLIKKLEKEEKIDRFFFLRYGDPHFHLRVRVRVKNIEDTGEIIAAFHSKLYRLCELNIIWKIQLDTYFRELERYHPALIETTEHLFSIESKNCVKILKKINSTHNEDFKWMIAFNLIDLYFDLFELDINRKLNLITDISNSFKSEFNFHDQNSKQFNTLYREKRALITDVIKTEHNEAGFKDLYTNLKTIKKELKPICQELLSQCKANKIHIQYYLASYIHMTLNRLLPSKNRIHELIIYDFLRRHYESEIAKVKNKA